jgi:LPXTG-motif cell wall-anchored protein
MFDNPLLNSAKKMAWYAGGGAAVVGVLIGFFVGRRRKR